MANSVTSPVVPQIPLLRKQDYPEGLGSQEALDKFFTLINPFFQGLGNALNGSLSIGNINGEVISFQVTTPSSPWLPLTLVSPWANLGPGYEQAGYMVDAVGRVWLQGVLTTGGSTVTPDSAVVGGNALIAQVPILPTISGTAPNIGSLPSLQWAAWNGITSGVRIDVGNSAVYNPGAAGSNLNVIAVTNALAAPQTMQVSLDGISYLSATGAPGGLSCFPKTVRLVSSQQPVDVWITSCIDAGNVSLGAGSPLVLPSAVSWNRINTNSGSNLIQINGIAGLALNRTYNIRCWVLYSAGTGYAGAGVSQALATAASSNG